LLFQGKTIFSALSKNPPNHPIVFDNLFYAAYIIYVTCIFYSPFIINVILYFKETAMKSGWLKNKRCSKCGSRSVYLDNYENEWFEHCLICGHETCCNTGSLSKQDK